jgi:hypothetical protein
MPDPIKHGDWVWVRDVAGVWHEHRAVTGPTRGRDFAVVWVCAPSEWRDDIEPVFPDAIPWPVEDVTLEEPADV